MRLLPACLVLGLLVVPGGSTHPTTGDALTHINVKVVQLDAGEKEEVLIETGEGPWEAGQLFILYIAFFNRTRDLSVELVYNHTDTVKAWHAASDDRHYLSTRIPNAVGPYELRLTNNAAGQTQFLFFFDQTCKCVVKPIPVDEGFVVFHYDLKEGRRVQMDAPVAAGWKVQAWLATLRDDAAAWPQDFDIRQEAVVEGGAPGEAWIRLRATPSQDERYYVFLRALEGSPVLPDPNKYVEISFLITETTPTKGSPGPGPLLLLAAAGALVWARRRPSRGAP